MELLETRNLVKMYDKFVALKDESIKIQPNKIVGLLGKNGSGKTTLIKLVNDLLTPSSGEVLVKGEKVGINSKKVISYLPERTYLNFNMRIKEVIQYFKDFYDDFREEVAYELLKKLGINPNEQLKTLSKGMKEKVQLILVMSRKAQLYILDEPIGGVDPAARDYILDTILKNFNEDASILISTHLISDIEKILDEVIFIKDGKIVLHESCDQLRDESGKSIDGYFREEFKC